MIPTIVICLSFLSGLLMSSPAQVHAVKLMEFGKYNCEDEMSKLDYLAVQLQENPDTYSYIIVYGGRRGMRRGEVRVRAARMRRYLVETRGINSDRIAVVDGGFRENLTVEFWRLARGEKPPAVTSTVDPKKVKFTKGKFERFEEPGCFPDRLPVPRARRA
ncbi:MAG: hypothetical protein AABN95_03880 [Acidobacteriota bacterium]